MPCHTSMKPGEIRSVIARLCEIIACPRCGKNIDLARLGEFICSRILCPGCGQGFDRPGENLAVVPRTERRLCL